MVENQAAKLNEFIAGLKKSEVMSTFARAALIILSLSRNGGIFLQPLFWF